MATGWVTCPRSAVRTKCLSRSRRPCFDRYSKGPNQYTQIPHPLRIDMVSVALIDLHHVVGWNPFYNKRWLAGSLMGDAKWNVHRWDNRTD